LPFEKLTFRNDKPYTMVKKELYPCSLRSANYALLSFFFYLLIVWLTATKKLNRNTWLLCQHGWSDFISFISQILLPLFILFY